MTSTAIVVRDGNAQVEITGELRDMVERVLEGVAPRVKRRFEEESRRIHAEARRYWPVRSGRSRDGFRVRTRFDVRKIEVLLQNVHPYAYKIKYSQWTTAELEQQAKTPKGAEWIRKRRGRGTPRGEWIMRSPFAIHIRAPVRKAERPLAADLEADLLRLAEGR